MLIRTIAIAIAALTISCGAEASPPCEPADGTLVSGITEGLTVSGQGNLRNAMTVKQPDDVWLLGADLDAPGLEGDGHFIAWTVGRERHGPILAANGRAEEFSDWGSAIGRVTADKKAIAALEACVE